MPLAPLVLGFPPFRSPRLDTGSCAKGAEREDAKRRAEAELQGAELARFPLNSVGFGFLQVLSMSSAPYLGVVVRVFSTHRT